jgi:hypothetical protein
VNNITNFAFRGTRDYLHSTTLFNYLVKLDSEPKNIDFFMNKETNLQCRVVSNREEDNDAALVAIYRSQGMTSYIYETFDKISLRNTCNEQEILSCIEISGKRAACPVPRAGATFIEVVVAAYKALVTSLPVYDGQKLVFARLIIDRLPNNSGFLIDHRRSLGTRFFEASILLEDQKIGKLIFGSK